SITFDVDVSGKILSLQLGKDRGEVDDTGAHPYILDIRIVVLGYIFQVDSHSVSFQPFYTIQWLYTALWPMAQVGTRAEIGMSFDRRQYGIRMPVSADTSPMLMNGHPQVVRCQQAIDAVPHI